MRERTRKNLLWLMGLNNPVVNLDMRFLQFRKATVYRLKITPQVCSMEKALNDQWDFQLRRIYITDGVELQPMILYRKEEAKKQVLNRKTEGDPKVLYTKSESAVYGVDFIVNVPLFLQFDAAEMTAFIEQIKLATKTFRIQLY